MAQKKKKSPWTIILAILLAMVIGSLTGTTAGIFGITFYSIYDIIGKLFINALMLVVVPLVSSSIITGIVRIGSETTFGRLGLKIFSFYLLTSFLAILIGLFFVNLLDPGFSYTAHAPQAVDSTAMHHIESFQTEQPLTMLNVIMKIIPSNIIEAYSGQMLGLIFFSLLFGYAMHLSSDVNHH
jgi:DAACS family dicarboxylate/amino acid:cation (Na+ or H+) symporter